MTDAWSNEGPDVSVAKREMRKARKEHLCWVCKKPIHVGRLYYHDWAVVEGRVEVTDQHLLDPEYECMS